jgi:hypothetical protein
VTIDERLEALTMNVELMQPEGRKFRGDLRRWAGVKEWRNHRKRITELETKSAEYQARTDQNLAQITDKLNGLIGYVDRKVQ